MEGKEEDVTGFGINYVWDRLVAYIFLVESVPWRTGHRDIWAIPGGPV